MDSSSESTRGESSCQSMSGWVRFVIVKRIATSGMSHRLRDCSLRSVVLAGYLLACGAAGLLHRHTPQNDAALRTTAADCRSASRSRCCHHHSHDRCRHSTDGEKAPQPPCEHGSECPCHEECAACQFLAQCALPVAVVGLTVVDFWADVESPVKPVRLGTEPLGLPLPRGPPA